MDVKLAFFLLSIFSQTYSFSMLENIINISRLIYFSTKATWEIVSLVGEDPLLASNIEKKLLHNLTVLQQSVDQVTNRLDTYQRAVLQKLLNIQSDIKYEIQMNTLVDNIIDIEANYKLFAKYLSIKHNSSIEKYTLQDFATKTVSHSDNSVYSKFLKLNILVLGNNHDDPFLRKGIFEVVSKHLSVNLRTCDLIQSPNQFLVNMFLYIQMIQLKAYVMIQHAWMLLHLYNKGNFIEEGNILKETFVEQVSDQTDSLLNSFKNAKNYMWQCDPQSHVSEKTYTQVTNFLQGYVINEVDINPSGTCWQNCGYYTYTKQYNCYQNLFCATQPKCNGTLVGCKFVESDMWVCHSPRNSNRFYDYTQFDGADMFGKETFCTASSKASSWWRWIFWHCSYCFCYCDDATNSERHFSLRPSVSDVLNNRVVTGIRFVKVKKVIHLQIQEGQLTEEAVVNKTTVSWLPLDAYEITNAKQGVDYHELTWEHRSIDLDDLTVPRGYVVTGVRFRMLGGHLNLEIHASPFSYSSGQLINPLKDNYWISNDNTDGNLMVPRQKVNLIKPDIPIRDYDGQPAILQSDIDSRTDQFIEFQSTDDTFDAAQTTVPFIDTQDVAPQPPVPLVGIGLYHKGRKNSGGFIAPKVFTYYNELNLIHFKEKLQNLYKVSKQ